MLVKRVYSCTYKDKILFALDARRHGLHIPSTFITHIEREGRIYREIKQIVIRLA